MPWELDKRIRVMTACEPMKEHSYEDRRWKLKIWIDKEEVVRKGACWPGIDLLDTIIRNQDELRLRKGKKPLGNKARIPWTPLSQAWLDSSGTHADWLYDAGIAPRIPLNNLDMGGQDLPCLEACNRNLRCTDFSKALLVDARFSGSNLSYTKFVGADLRDAVFFEAYLSDTDFRGADLRRASFERASFFGVRFENALITEPGINARAKQQVLRRMFPKYTADYWSIDTEGRMRRA